MVLVVKLGDRVGHLDHFRSLMHNKGTLRAAAVFESFSSVNVRRSSAYRSSGTVGPWERGVL